MSYVNYPCNEIKHIEDWEFILDRPFYTLGKKSLYGLQCFITGLSYAKSDIFYKDGGEDFRQWLSTNEVNVGDCFTYTLIDNSFSYALSEAGGDDEKAFDVWAGWYRTYKAKRKVEDELTVKLKEEINKEIDQEIIAELKKYQEAQLNKHREEDFKKAIDAVLLAIQEAIVNKVPFPELKKDELDDSNK